MLRRLAVVPALIFAAPALGLEVKPCADANVGIAEIVQPAEAHSRSYAGDRVSVYAIDTVEPVCCSGGVAVVMPDPESEVGANKCFAVVGVASVQLDGAAAEEKTDEMLHISVPTRVFNGSDEAVAGEPIRLRIDAEKGTLALDE